MTTLTPAAFDLNPPQRAAVEHPGGPLLVLAGAGSGKTRVLTARVARLLERGVAPGAVLAFTFTNRAAREMRERIERAVGEAAARALWVGTFHATGVRILRREAARLGLPRDFAIYDRDDQEGVVREIVRRLALPEAAYRPSAVLVRISDAKSALVGPADFERLAISPHERRLAEVYALYDAELARAGALDFDDLIARVVKLFRDDAAAAERWGRRFEHVLVDEYQDTNHAQFRLVEALAAGHRNLFVVGDDDQSIYGWRGADLSNLLDFERAFPGAAVVRLEQNYRSTANILRAANAVIANNRSRRGKTLWCEREDGVRLRFALAADEADEARRIRRFLDQRVADGRRYDECAVLYRTNAQSRALETELRGRGIPYEIVGGVAFYQRREVKDLLSYLRLAVNGADGAAFWRIWNTPRRGLGDAVRLRVEERIAAAAAAGQALEPPAALAALAREEAIPRAAIAGATDLLELVRELQGLRGGPLDALFAHLLQRTGYLDMLDEDPTSAAERRANVEELAAAVAAFTVRAAPPLFAGPGALAPGFAPAPGVTPEEGAVSLADFLTETALVTDADRLEEGADRVLLLTAHNAKGLEFPFVVVAGLEEGLFPHSGAGESDAELEEERRLFYVALTRARDSVLLTAAAYRRRFAPGGGMIASGGQVSRFVEEIPEELLEREIAAPVSLPVARRGAGTHGGWRAPGGAGSRGASAPAVARGARPGVSDGGPRHAAVGRVVYHERFGRGVVVEAEGAGADLKCTVRFDAGVKRVLGRFLSGGTGDDPA